MAEGKLFATLSVFHENGAQVIVVGGVASVLNGAPVNTFDIDLVYSLDPLNIERLEIALDRLDAIFRIQPERRLRPNRSHLAKGGHLNLVTRFGFMDLLGSIGHGLDYSRLLPESTEMEIGGGLRVLVLNLKTIILSKEQAAREKDQATLPILRQTLKEQRKPDYD